MALNEDFKMAGCIEHKTLQCDKLTIISAKNETNELKVQKYVIKNWNALTKGMENSTILFMGGAHGDAEGNLTKNENIQTLKNQVSI